jgi:hypothetical protein
VNCAVPPGTVDTADGEIKMDKRVAEGTPADVTVIRPWPATPDIVAVMVAEPAVLLITTPVLEIWAMVVLDELQTAESVMSLLD